jgi:hypothetical protein
MFGLVKSAHCDFGKNDPSVKEVTSLMHQGDRNAVLFEPFPNRNKAPGVRKGLSSVLPVVTENGFTLLAGSRLGGTTEHRFQVRSASDEQQNVSVRFGRSLMARVDEVRKSHLWIGSRFWGFLAKARLEGYLSEKADYPPNAQLMIDDLSDDEMLLAAHWKD